MLVIFMRLNNFISFMPRFSIFDLFNPFVSYICPGFIFLLVLFLIVLCYFWSCDTWTNI